MKSLASELEDVRFVVIHVDRRGEVLERFEASTVPGYILFRDGREIDRLLIFPGWEEMRLRRMIEGARGG